MAHKFYAVYPPQADVRSERNTAFSITRLASFDNLLFIGCKEGKILLQASIGNFSFKLIIIFHPRLLLQSVFEETEENITCYSFSLIISRKVTEYPIADLAASRATAIVIILAGDQLQAFHAETLEPFNIFPSLGSVVSFSLQRGPTAKDSSSTLAVCFKTTTLNVYHITKARCDVTYSVQLPSIATVMLCATDYLVFATSTHYLCLDFKTKCINELFARTEKHIRPLISQVSETEFLLSGPGALGIFVDSTGASQRPPISLSSNLSSLFCQDSLIFAVDDEFVTIHSAKNQEQLQTLIVKNTSTACMSLDGKRLFLTSSQPVRFPEIYTVRPETWDMVARRLVLAGCTAEAQDCVQRQYRRLLDLCAERPATSSTAKLLFNARSKRVFTLMGFYFFEIGRLPEAKQFFEKSSLNVCELLYRYVDLLPQGYTFTPSCELNVSMAVQAQVENPGIATPNTIFDLAETLASSSKDKDPAVSVRKYRIFLLDFLLEHRRSRIFEKHTLFVETALFKLCVLLQDYVSSDLLTPESSLSATYGSWEALIASFRNVDVKDLFTFLSEHAAHHAHALLCSWQGDMSTALDIWKRLVFGELKDPSFPGPNFYLNTLITILVKPLSFHGDSPSLLRATSPDQLPTAGQLVGSPLHADLVWQHLGSMLTSKQTGMAEQLLVHVGKLTLWRDVGMNTAAEPTARPFEVGKPFASFPLSPENLLCRLLPEFPVLAERYLWHRVFDAGDKDAARLATLADLQLDLLLKAADGPAEELSRCRTRFRKTLLSPNELPLYRLLEKVTTSQCQQLLLEEQIILLCRLERHEDALRILVHERHDVEAALRYCNWCVLIQLRLHAAREACMWSESSPSQHPSDVKVIGSSTGPAEPNIYGTLFGLLLDDAKKPGSRKRLLRLLNSEIPMSDSVEVFKQLPPDLPLNQLTHFLQRTLRSVLCAVSASEIDLGLYRGLCTSSVMQAEAAAPAPLVLQEDTVCTACNLRLDAYGPAKPFAWLLPEHKPVHLHCLPSDSVI